MVVIATRLSVPAGSAPLFGFRAVFFGQDISQKYNYFTLEERIARAKGLAV